MEGHANTHTHTHTFITLYERPPAATYFVAVFALVGISVLESMLVLFVMDMEAYCSSKFCKPVEAEVEIQLHDHGQYTGGRSQ